MLDSIFSMFGYPFITRALIGGIAIALCAALLGVMLVLKRYSMIGDGLSHVGFGAIAVASALGFAPLAVAIPVVIIAALLLLRISSDSGVKGDSAVAMVSAASLAAGVMAVSVKEGMNASFESYMFGSIMGMSDADVILAVLICVPVIVLYIVFYNKLFAVTFDETFCKATGVKAGLYNGICAVLTALTVVLGMRLMGALLISSLVIFPALTAMRVCRSFKSVVICASVISVICFTVGIMLSVALSLPTGAAVVAVNAAAFCVFAVAGKFRK